MGRVLTTQYSALQRDLGKWSFNKYDELNRPIYSGEISSTANRTSQQSTIDAQTTSWETKNSTGEAFLKYTKNTYPTVLTENNIYTVNYYDDYTGAWATGKDILSGITTTNRTKANAKGMLVATQTNNQSLAKQFTVYFYDNKARVIQTRQFTTLSNKTAETTSDIAYSFAGEILKHYIQYKIVDNGTKEFFVKNEYQYDHMGRKIACSHGIGNGNYAHVNIPLNPIATYHYDAIGRMTTKKIAPGAYPSSVAEGIT
ncbi:MAG: hypothetical protein KA313_10925, partial [Pseudarcicella sp.]|nr:hypothetical protein [Pseudarcicella sp.]